MENKTSKYFKYAIGEIILVVIGILIALQINNWNTNKTNEKEAYNQLLEVQKEIVNNIIEFDKKGAFYFQKLRDVRRVFSDTLTIEDYHNSKTLRNIITRTSSIITQDEAFKKLIENADNLPEKYKLLITDLKQLYNHSVLERSYNNLSILTNQYFDFIFEYSESIYRNKLDAYLQFQLTNKSNKNKLARFSWTLDDLAPEIIRKKYDAISVYNQMLELGFPELDNAIIKSSIKKHTPKFVNSFEGKYTNTIDTISIYSKNEKFLGYYSKYDFTDNLTIRDSTSLIFYGTTFEFNDSKSKFYYLMDGKPIFKRIPQND